MSKKKNMYKLESLARLISGRTPEREQKEYYAETGTPWVKIENLDQGYIREASEYLSEQGKEKVNLVPENSVLFPLSARSEKWELPVGNLLRTSRSYL